MPNNRILLITTASLSTNPRLLKECISLQKKGYQVKIKALLIHDEWHKKDLKVISEYGIEVSYQDVRRTNFLFWAFYSFLHIVATFFYQKFHFKQKIIKAFASDKRSIALYLNLQFNSLEHDLVIAHNFGALYPAYSILKKGNVPFFFDVEDYHPGERVPSGMKYLNRLREDLFKELLQHASAITFASPLIKKKTEELIGEQVVSLRVVNNSFFEEEFVHPVIKSEGKLKLVWFSQYINEGRGLELLWELPQSLKEQVHITLIGEVSASYFESELKHVTNLTVKPAMLQKELHKELAHHDIGLALEQTSADLNRNLCLTNKIFAYAQSGLYILATDTMAQVDFMKSHHQLGILISQDVEGYIKGICELLEHKENIRKTATERFQYGKKINYNHEFSKIEKLIQDL